MGYLRVPALLIRKLESLSLSPFPPSFLSNFLLIFYAIEVIFIFSNWLEEDKSSPYPFCILLVLVNRPVRSGKLLSRPEWFLAEWNRHYGNVAGQLWNVQPTLQTDTRTHTHERKRKEEEKKKKSHCQLVVAGHGTCGVGVTIPAVTNERNAGADRFRLPTTEDACVSVLSLRQR